MEVFESKFAIDLVRAYAYKGFSCLTSLPHSNFKEHPIVHLEACLKSHLMLKNAPLNFGMHEM